MKRNKFVFVLLGIVLLLANLEISLVSASHINCGDYISTNTVLDSDLICSNAGLFITASGITLDCNGHSITGSGSYVGISMDIINSATVKNCEISNFTNGFDLFQSNNNNLLNNTLHSNVYGFYLFLSDSNKIKYNLAKNNSFYGFNSWNITKTAGENIIGGPFLGGNSWHDYNGTDLDSDGIGDTNIPYNKGIKIEGDFLPLVKP